MAIPPPPPENPWNEPQHPAPPGPPPAPHQGYGTPYGQSPYGAQPYGGQPYGTPSPYGMPPAVPKTNGLAIASLVTGIICCVPPLGLVLGLVALSQIRKRGDAGKGMAVAGIVLSSLSVVLVLVGILTGGLTAFKEGFERGAGGSGQSVEDLRTGQCFDTPDGSLEGTTYNVEVVDCAKPHDGEVFGTFDLADSAEYPGDEKIGTIADGRCATAEASYTGGAQGSADSYYLMPDKNGWRLGDRGVTCVFGDESGGKLTGTLRDEGTGGTNGSGGTDGSSGSGGSTGGSEGDAAGAGEEV